MISFPLILNNSKHSLQKTGFFFGICTYQWGPWWLLFFPLGMVPSDLAMVSGGIFHHGLLLKNPITMWVCHGKIHHFYWEEHGFMGDIEGKVPSGYDIHTVCHGKIHPFLSSVNHLFLWAIFHGYVK